MISVGVVWTTWPSTKKVAVADQSIADTLTTRPNPEELFGSILVNGQGPAMHETRTSLNAFPASASREREPMLAFHLPSGEQGGLPRQRTPFVFTTSKVLARLPMFAVVVVFKEYLTRTSATTTSGPWGSI